MVFQPEPCCDLTGLQNTQIRVNIIYIWMMQSKVLYFEGMLKMILISCLIWSEILCKTHFGREGCLTTESAQYFKQNCWKCYMSQMEQGVKWSCFYLSMNFWMQNKCIPVWIVWHPVHSIVTPTTSMSLCILHRRNIWKMIAISKALGGMHISPRSVYIISNQVKCPEALNMHQSPFLFLVSHLICHMENAIVRNI